MSDRDRSAAPGDEGHAASRRSDRDTLPAPPSAVALQEDEVAAAKAARAHAVRYPPWRLGSSAPAHARPVDGTSARRPRSR